MSRNSCSLADLKSFSSPENNCLGCSASQCPTPDGIGWSGPYKIQKALERICHNCFGDPLVNSFSNGGGCNDPANECWWMRDKFIFCDSISEPSEVITCPERELVKCVTGGCTDADGDGYFKEEPSCQTGPFDCDDTRPDINPGPNQIEDCFDEGFPDDEDCSGGANCADVTSCRNVYQIECNQACDKDGDGHYATTAGCGGDDCLDDPAISNIAYLIHPGIDAGTQEPTFEWSCNNSFDEDCDGLLNCDDPDCAENQSCLPTPTPTPDGGGPDPQAGSKYCIGAYEYTDWYYWHTEYMQWEYLFTTEEYSVSCYDQNH